MRNIKINGLSNYVIYDNGGIYSLLSNRFLQKHLQRQINGSNGYYQLFLKDDNNISKWYKIHRLVAIAFIPNVNNYKCVNHLNGNKLDNRVQNLEWCTYQQNTKHAIENGLIKPTKKGSQSPNFGKKHSIETKNKVSLSKQGEKHHKFKGYYIINNNRYTSIRQASIKENIDYRKVKRVAEFISI